MTIKVILARPIGTGIEAKIKKTMKKIIENALNEEPGPILYRADLIKAAFEKSGRGKFGSFGNYRQTADDIGIAVNTLRDAVAGTASKIENLYRIARYFEIPWIELFNVDRVTLGEPVNLTLRAERGGPITIEGGTGGGWIGDITPGTSKKFRFGRITVHPNKTK